MIAPFSFDFGAEISCWHFLYSPLRLPGFCRMGLVITPSFPCPMLFWEPNHRKWSRIIKFFLRPLSSPLSRLFLFSFFLRFPKRGTSVKMIHESPRGEKYFLVCDAFAKLSFLTLVPLFGNLQKKWEQEQARYGGRAGSKNKKKLVIRLHFQRFGSQKSIGQGEDGVSTDPIRQKPGRHNGL